MGDPEQPTERSIWLWGADEKADAGQDGFRAWLDPYPLETRDALGAVLVCPGGGYGGRAAHESGPVARRFNALGFHGFVVHYSVSPRRHPQPLRDVARALRLIRQRAAAWSVVSEQIAVCGFSAGGHLTASLGVHWASEWVRGDSPLDRLSCRPGALILCYPVITAGEHGHAGSFQNLLGPDAPEALRQRLSAERQVAADTPPAFLWHTGDDAGVPVENSLLFAQALRRHGVPFELHVYPHGSHGLGLAEGDPHVATWTSLCGDWLAGMGWRRA